jgi:hypothetical protein
VSSGLRSWTLKDVASHQSKIAGVAHSAEHRIVDPKVVGSKPATRAKYLNRKVYFDRILFDSESERKRYVDLRVMEAGRLISHLVVHPVFPLFSNGVLVGRYVADFRYLDGERKEVVEDVKSPRTAKLSTFRLKLKMVKADHAIDVQVIGA